MTIRIGDTLVTAEGLYLVCAYGVFLWLAYRGLRDGKVSPARLLVALVVISAAGVLGAVLYGIPGMLSGFSGEGGVPIRSGITFGSFGGYWGVLLGGIAAARLLNRPVLPVLDALVPPILLGGAVARMADVMRMDSAFGWSLPLPLGQWAVLDTAALIGLYAWVAFGWKSREESNASPIRIPGAVTAYFLVGYGTIRFVLEWFRAEPPLIAVFSWGHGMSLLQVVAGLLLMRATYRATTPTAAGPRNATRPSRR